MNEIEKLRNKRMGEKLIKNFSRRMFDAYYCESSTDVQTLIKKIVPEQSTITWGGSSSIFETGVAQILKDGNYQVFDRADAKNADEKMAIYRKAFSCDYYLASANAISEDGQIINIDGNGNRIAAITWGPHHVIFIVGINKVCKDIDSAMKRARNTAAPVNMTRFENLDTPCHKDGLCHDCLSPDSICNYFSVIRRSQPAHRHIVILVGENLGY